MIIICNHNYINDYIILCVIYKFDNIYIYFKFTRHDMEKALSDVTIKSIFFQDSFLDNISDDVIIKKINGMINDNTLSLSDIDNEIDLDEQKLIYLKQKIRIIEDDVKNEILLFKAIHKNNKTKKLSLDKDHFNKFTTYQSTQKLRIKFLEGQCEQYNLFMKYLLNLRNDFIINFPQSEKSPISPRNVLRHSPRRSSGLRTSQTLTVSQPAIVVNYDDDESNSSSNETVSAPVSQSVSANMSLSSSKIETSTFEPVSESPSQQQFTSKQKSELIIKSTIESSIDIIETNKDNDLQTNKDNDLRRSGKRKVKRKIHKIKSVTV